MPRLPVRLLTWALGALVLAACASPPPAPSGARPAEPAAAAATPSRITVAIRVIRPPSSSGLRPTPSAA